MKWTVRDIRWSIFAVALAVACPARAQEFSVLGGLVQDAGTHDRSYSWQLEYKEGLGEHFAFSLSYVNEGHFPSHHRDGGTGQLWARTNVLDRRLSLAAGIGPYYYFNTTTASAEGPYVNDHGWGAMTSLGATWYTESRWLYQLRANWAGTGGRDTASAVFGIGYQLDPAPLPGPLPKAPPQREQTTHNEITVFVGRTIVNSFGSENSVAASIEYRRGLRRYVDWTVSWLHEGDNDMIQRNGFVTQLWAVKAFFNDRLALGVGGGAYYTVDRYRDQEHNGAGDKFLAGIITLTSSYRFHPHWGVRASLNRVFTNYSRDTDVIMGGIGYLF